MKRTTVLISTGQVVLTADEYNSTVVYNTIAKELGKDSKKFLRFCRSTNRTDETSLPITIVDEFGDRYTVKLKFEKATTFKLVNDWCGCDNPEFHSYPQDGECSCGRYKHHVHCANCGAITQVG